jgi:hypothetical protein
LKVQLINGTQKEKQTMKINFLLITLALFAALLFAGCAPKARVGALQTESQSIELGDAESVRVEINFGVGDLKVTSGAEKLLEADFTYNVAELKPEVKYADGTLVFWQPENEGLPDLRGITDFRNEWGLRLSDKVPMDLRVEMGAGSSDFRLGGPSLTRLDITLGAGGSTIDLSGDWARGLNVSISAGAGDITVHLPRDVGVRVTVDAGGGAVEAPGLEQEGNIYTNVAYGVSEVTLQINIDAGVGQINLEVED